MNGEFDARVQYLKRAAPIAAVLFIIGVVAAMVAALIQTVSLTVSNPVPVDGSNIAVIGSPPVDFANRLSVFTSAGTNLTIVLLLVGASLLTTLQERTAWRRFTVVSVAVLAVIVVVADLVMEVEVGISNGPLFFTGVDATTRATGIVGLMAPAVVAAAAGVVAWFGYRFDAHFGTRRPTGSVGSG